MLANEDSNTGFSGVSRDLDQSALLMTLQCILDHADNIAGFFRLDG